MIIKTRFMVASEQLSYQGVCSFMSVQSILSKLMMLLKHLRPLFVGNMFLVTRPRAV